MTATLYAEPRFAPGYEPTSRRPRCSWGPVFDALRGQPGVWAAVGQQDSGRWPVGTATLERHGCELAMRSNGDGTWTVWMRSVAEPERVAQRSRRSLVTFHLAGGGVTHKWYRGERRES